ncbi:MAG: glucosylceramidase [Firmicutes bacterium]|nr:glucosylceramidase [Bacillota bacterium]
MGEQLIRSKGQRILPKEAVAARFLLGGIGTGNVSIGSRGNFTDFELHGLPNKGMDSPYTFFALRTQDSKGKTVMKALEGEMVPPFDHSHGFTAWEIGGLPRFQATTMVGEYPFVWVDYQDDQVPLKISLEAYTPMIPLNVEDSALPCGLIKYTVKNISDETQNVSIVGSFANLCNYTGRDIWNKPLFNGESVNTYTDQGEFRGLSFTTQSKEKDDLNYMDMGLFVRDKEVFYREYWNEGAWWDGLQDFWNDFSEDGELDQVRSLSGDGNRMHQSDIKIGSLGMKKVIEPGQSEEFLFILSWCHPWRIRSWDQLQDYKENGRCLIKNYYASLYPSAVDAADYLVKNFSRLEELTIQFHNSLFLGTYPDYVLDAVASNLTVIRSNTCFQVEDGTFFAYEGCFANAGCCDGNCTHVWNYAQSLAYLYPTLEQSMRRTEFLEETSEEGNMSFRARTYLQDETWVYPPAADGQLGSVIRLYRDWKFSGDNGFLEELWPKAQNVLEFAKKYWDEDKDGALDGQQHNTYDIEFYGMNTLVNSIYIAALKAGEQIAKYLGQSAKASEYYEMWMRASEVVDHRCYNGSYYIQSIEDVNSHKYQYGDGCLADQLLGQQLAHLVGLGYVMQEEHIKKATKAIYDNNYKKSMKDHCNLQRTYALNDEAGLLICTWPKGNRPEIPFVYSDEVWTGIEYQVATHLIQEGFLEEGLSIVKAVRDRHDGVRRSPWNEVECGHHYARSLASYGVMLALSGYQCDLPGSKLKISPLISQDKFHTFFSCQKAWGTITVETDKVSGDRSVKVDVLYGNMDGIEIELL